MGEMTEMILKLFFFFIALWFPVFSGLLFVDKKGKISFVTIIESYLLGQFLMWSVFQLIAVPIVRLKLHFSLLFFVYLGILILLSILGIVRWLRRQDKINWDLSLPKTPVIWIVLGLAVAVILYQCGMYVFGLHLDEDDARWLAEANDALIQDRMFLHNPSNGSFIGRFGGDMVRDSISPWPMYIAFLSRMTGIRVATLSHTVYAPVLLIISYMAYARIGSLVFKGKEERIVFLFAISVIMLFFGGQSASESTFSLIRIWQGKAVVAAVTVPAILSQILKIQAEDTPGNWLILFMMCCGSCLFSGMGVVISAIMIGGYGFYLIVCRRWKRIPYWLLAILPAAVFELILQALT